MKNSKTIRSGPLYRSAVFEMVHGEDTETFIDEEKRTVTLSFSSTEPVEREFGYEILDHSEGSIDLDRLRTAGPMLVNHDRNDVVGVIEKVWVSAGKSFAQVRFGRSARATEVFNDVIDGIRRTVSFGYRVSEMVRSEMKDKGSAPTFVAKKWEPFEVSLEVLPADPTVGVGRNSDEEFENNIAIIEETRELAVPIETISIKETVMSDKNTENTVDTKAVRESGIKAERKRINGIRKTADNVRSMFPDVDTLAEEYSNSERTLDEFNAAIVAKMDSVKMEALEARQNEASFMTNEEVGRYSITRLVQALDTGDWSDAKFEQECSNRYAEMTGQKPRGAFVPFDVINSTRANETTSTNAGSLIATDFWGENFIETLRKKSVVAGMGARMLSGLVGNVDIPKASNGATYTWVAEGVDATRTAMAFETVSLSPETISAEVLITRKMIKQTSNPTIDGLIRDELMKGIVQFLDETALVGAGTGVIPSGVTVDPTVNQVGGTGLTWESAVSAETLVATSNADFGKLGYVCGPTVRGIAKTKVKDASGAGGFIMGGDQQINGYPVGVTTAMGNNIAFGNWDDLIVAMWGGVDLELDKTAAGASGGQVLRAFLDADVKFRNQESFSVQKGIVG